MLDKQDTDIWKLKNECIEIQKWHHAKDILVSWS